MGDGKVALILDVLGLAQRAERRVRACATGRWASKRRADRGVGGDRDAVAAVRHARRRPDGDPAGPGRPAGGVPAHGRRDGRRARSWCSTAARSCRSSTSRGYARPATTAASRPTPIGDTVQVVVYAGRGQRVGLVVERILDIVEEAVAHAVASDPARACCSPPSSRTASPSSSTWTALIGRRPRLSRRSPTMSRRPPVLHVLPRRPLLRHRRAEGAGGHPLPGDDARAAGPPGGPRADQPARPDRHRHRPAPPAGAARPRRPTSCR